MPEEAAPAPAFDYIICGAGAAGCVVANRLSADPRTSVLLIEAGPDARGLFTKMPRGFPKLLTTEKYARFFKTGPDNGAKPAGEMWARGRMLGGSSTLNGMMYFHGHASDYDDWVAAGNPGWGWADIGPIFKAMENHALGAGKARGTGGPLQVTVGPERSLLIDALIAAGGAMGIPVVDDLNEPRNEAIGYTPYNTGRGLRSGAAEAFLRPAMKRSNLTVITDTLVTRVLFEGRRAVGVATRSKGVDRDYRADREVILSGGALQTPQLLQLSGIGAAARLAALGLEVLQDSPGVGENLREHCLIVMQRRLLRQWSANREISGWRLPLNVARWMLARSGPMAVSGFEMSGFVRAHPASTRPDVHLIVSRTSMDLRSWDGWTKGPTVEKLPGLTMMGYPSNPRSQGSVHIRSADPAEAPEIKAGYLTHAHDRETSIAMFRRMRTFLDHPSLSDVIGEETVPAGKVESDDEILAAFDTYGGPGYHACGTARMGNDAMAVVDHRLRVRGVAGLRVIDISIFPTQTSANTNGPAMATAWRGADLVIEDRNRTAVLA